MKNATMLYKFPGQHEMHGAKFDYTIVDEDEIKQAQAAGWHLTTTDAKAAHEAPPAAIEAPAKRKAKA